MSEVAAGHDSMRTVRSRMLRKRAPMIQQTSASPNNHLVKSISEVEDQEPSRLNSSLNVFRKAVVRRESTKCMKWKLCDYVNKCQDNLCQDGVLNQKQEPGNKEMFLSKIEYYREVNQKVDQNCQFVARYQEKGNIFCY